jgi:lysophospholipase L1-like esterase
LAFTLPTPSSLNAGAKLLDFIEANRQTYDALFLCFGEIDARAHVLKQAALKGLTVEQVVGQVLDNYFAYIDELRQRFDVPVFLWGPLGSTPDGDGIYNSDFPTVGGEVERNYATALLNERMAARSDARQGVHYISIIDQLIDVDLRTRVEYYQDGVHLNRKGLSMAVREIRRRMTELGYAEFASRFPSQVFCSERGAIKDLSSIARFVHVSSCLEGMSLAPVGVTNPDGRPFIFHTEMEDRPKVVIDLGSVRMIQRIEIHNRLDGFQDRAQSMAIGISNSRFQFANVFRHATTPVFGVDGKPLVLGFAQLVPLRYLQLELERRDYFHLSQIRIWGQSFLN